MRNSIARSLAPALLATFTAALAGLVLDPSASPVVAAETAAPKPAKKDSRLQDSAEDRHADDLGRAGGGQGG